MQYNEQGYEKTVFGDSRELLTFTLGREEYGIDILNVATLVDERMIILLA